MTHEMRFLLAGIRAAGLLAIQPVRKDADRLVAVQTGDDADAQATEPVLSDGADSSGQDHGDAHAS